MKRVLFVLFAMLLTLTGCGEKQDVPKDSLKAKYLIGTWTSIGQAETLNGDIILRSSDKKMELIINSENDVSLEVTESNDKFQKYKVNLYIDQGLCESINELTFTHEEVNSEGETDIIEEAGNYMYFSYVKTFKDEEIDGPLLYWCMDPECFDYFVLTKNK